MPLAVTVRVTLSLPVTFTVAFSMVRHVKLPSSVWPRALVAAYVNCSVGFTAAARDLTVNGVLLRKLHQFLFALMYKRPFSVFNLCSAVFMSFPPSWLTCRSVHEQ